MNTDPRLQFTCGVPNATNTEIVYQEDPQIGAIVQQTGSISMYQSDFNHLAVTYSPDCGQRLLSQYWNYSTEQWVDWWVGSGFDTAHECIPGSKTEIMSMAPNGDDTGDPKDISDKWRVILQPNAFSTGATSRTIIVGTDDAYSNPGVQVTQWGSPYGSTVAGQTIGVTPTTVAAGTTVTTRWFIGNTVVGTGSTLTLADSWVGRNPVLRITASKPGFADVTKSWTLSAVRVRGSAGTSGVVTKWSAKASKVKVGKTAKITATRALPGSRISYRWYVSNKKVAVGTRSVKMRKAWKGKTVTVRVTVSKSGYATANKTVKLGKVRK